MLAPADVSTRDIDSIDASFRSRQERCVCCGVVVHDAVPPGAQAEEGRPSPIVVQCPSCAAGHGRIATATPSGSPVVSLWATPSEAIARRGRAAKDASDP